MKPITLFYLEWDAQHLSIKNDVLPFYSYSIKWENIRFIKFTTLYQGKTLLLAGKDYAVKAYIIKALPQKSIKEIYRAMKKPEYLSKTIWIFNKQRRFHRITCNTQLNLTLYEIIMHSLLRKKLYFYISASLPLVMIAVTILVILESHTFVQYGIILLLIVFTIYNIYLFGHNNPIRITYDNEKIRIHYLFPRLNKTFYWREIHNMDLCQKAYMRMYGAKLPEMALIIKDKEQEVALWWNYYSKLNRIYLYWTTLKNRTSQEPIQSYKFNYQIFKKPLWSLLNFYLTMFFSFFSICFIYGVLPIFPILALTMGSFGLICSYYGLGQHLFYLEWDAQHLSIKNDLLPFLTYSIAWKDVRSIKFTTLYGDKSLWIADKEYNFKEYRIEAVPDKAIKGIYREMRKNDIPVENDIDN